MEGSEHIAAKIFTFRELAQATAYFRAESLLGEGGFGRVYKGRLDNINQVFLNDIFWTFLFRSDEVKLLNFKQVFICNV